jgi:hypothetical protein
VRAALDTGAQSLTRVTDLVLDELPDSERFAAAGRVVETVARLSRPESDLERAWLPVRGELLIEEWQLAGENRD